MASLRQNLKILNLLKYFLILLKVIRSVKTQVCIFIFKNTNLTRARYLCINRTIKFNVLKRKIKIDSDFFPK